jgi:hypothetical protein
MRQKRLWSCLVCKQDTAVVAVVLRQTQVTAIHSMVVSDRGAILQHAAAISSSSN